MTTAEPDAWVPPPWAAMMQAMADQAEAANAKIEETPMQYAVRDKIDNHSFIFDTVEDSEADLLARFPDAPEDVRQSVAQFHSDMLTGFKENSGAGDYLGLVAVKMTPRR